MGDNKPKTYIEPIQSKHYGTRIVSGNITVEVYDSRPWKSGVSEREYEVNKWEPDYGMDHVESAEQYEVAMEILKLLESGY